MPPFIAAECSLFFFLFEPPNSDLLKYDKLYKQEH